MTKQTVAITRAVGVIGATVALVTGITFANLTSNTVTLTDNKLSTATASLALVNGPNEVITLPGFNFVGLLPGVESATFPFKLRNTGSTPMVISATFPGFTVTGITKDKIHMKLTAVGFAPPLDGVLSDYENNTFVLPGTTLAPGADQAYTITATIDSSYSGSGGTLTPFGIVFTGTQPVIVLP